MPVPEDPHPEAAAVAKRAISESGISVQQAHLEGTQGFAVTVKEGGKELAVFLPDDHARQIADYILHRAVPINFSKKKEPKT